MAEVEGTPFAKVKITKGDTLRGPCATLKDSSDAAVDLTDSTVAFRMVLIADSSVKINSSAANIDSAAAGQVSYDFVAADVNAAGEYAAWWIRTEGGKTERFPSGNEYIYVLIATDY